MHARRPAFRCATSATRGFLALGAPAERDERLAFVEHVRNSAFAGLPMTTADQIMGNMIGLWGPWRAQLRAKRAGVTEITED